MSIYTTAPIVGLTSTEFLERDLTGQGPARLTSVQIQSINTGRPRLNFTMVMANLHLFLKSMLTQMAFFQGSKFMASFPDIYPLGLARPILNLVLKSKDAEAEEQLVKNGMIYDSARKAYRGSPDWESFKGLLLLQYKSTQLQFGEVNVEGYLAYFFLMKGILAYIGASHVTEDATVFITKKCVRLTDDVSTATELKVPNTRATGEVEISSSEDVSTMLGYEALALYAPQLVFTPAFDSKSGPTVANGTQRFARMTGHVFPYFDGLLLPDNDTISFTFFRLFARCLTASDDNVQALLPRIRRGITNLARTRIGMMLSHIYFGIQLSLDSECAYDIIIEGGIYRGFVLEGSHVLIMDRGVMKNALNEKEFDKAISSLNRHEKALDRLVVELQLYAGDSLEYLKAEHINTSWKLGNLMWKIDFSNLSDKSSATILDLVDRLSYNEEFMKVTPKTISEAIQGMANEQDPFKSQPMVLGNGLIFSKDIITRILMHFGYRVPSPFNGASSTFSIARRGKSDPNIIKDKDGVRPLHYLPFVMKPLKRASDDFRIMFEKRVIRLSVNKKWQKGTKAAWCSPQNMSYRVDGDLFDDAYEAIKKACDVYGAIEKPKRKRDDPDDDDEDEDEDGKEKKKAKVTLDVSML